MADPQPEHRPITFPAPSSRTPSAQVIDNIIRAEIAGYVIAGVLAVMGLATAFSSAQGCVSDYQSEDSAGCTVTEYPLMQFGFTQIAYAALFALLVGLVAVAARYSVRSAERSGT